MIVHKNTESKSELRQTTAEADGGSAAWLPQIDGGSPVPLYEQIIEQVAMAVAVKALRPGDALPSVRRLAAQLRINPNTAARVGRELDRLGLARSIRGVGSVVAEGAAKQAPVVARRVMDRELSGVVQVAHRLGMSLEELLGQIKQRWQQAGDRPGTED